MKFIGIYMKIIFRIQIIYGNQVKIIFGIETLKII